MSGNNAVLVIPDRMLKKAGKVSCLVREIISVKPDEHYLVNGLQFDTIPAYNKVKPFHSKNAGWVGYILQVDEKRVYIAGDTDATKKAKQIRCDIELVPIGGTFTMDAKKAAELMNIQPCYCHSYTLRHNRWKAGECRCVLKKCEVANPSSNHKAVLVHERDPA